MGVTVASSWEREHRGQCAGVDSGGEDDAECEKSLERGGGDLRRGGT